MYKYCDFQSVTKLLYSGLIKSTIKSYNVMMSDLFGAYNAAERKQAFTSSELSRLGNGRRVPSKTWVDFYQRNDKSVMLADIMSIIPNIVDKTSVQKALFELYTNDRFIPDEYMQAFLSNHKPEYSDDNTLAELIYDVLFISIVRPYEEKTKEHFVVIPFDASDYETPVIEQKADAPTVNTNSQATPDTLFANSEYVPPCQHFCGYASEIDDLNTMFEKDTKLFVTGFPCMGKSEFIRAYIEKYGAQYKKIGYYFYNGSLCRIISNMNSEVPVSLSDTNDALYLSNLNILRTLDESTLIVIDNFNIGIEDDECLDDIFKLKCRVIFTSRRRYEGVTAFRLNGISENDGVELAKKFFDNATPLDEFRISGIVRMLGESPLFIEIVGKMLKKGGCNTERLTFELLAGDYTKYDQKVTFTKDGRLMKESLIGVLRNMFGFSELSELHRKVLCMIHVAVEAPIRKDAAIAMFGLNSVQPIDDLIDAGFVTETSNGMIQMSHFISDIIFSALKPDKNTCRELIDRIRLIGKDESIQYDFGDIRNIIAEFAFFPIVKPASEAVEVAFDCFKFFWRIHDIKRMKELNERTFALRGLTEPKQLAIQELEEAAIEAEKRNYVKALEIQKNAIEKIMALDDEYLKAEAVSSYAHYLEYSETADSTEELYEAYQRGIELFEGLELDNGGKVEQCRVITRYAHLLLMTCKTDEALAWADRAVNTLANLRPRTVPRYESYADALYVGGLCHLLKNDDKLAKFELDKAFHIYLMDHKRESDFIEDKLEWVFNFALDMDSDIMRTKPLKYLFEVEDDYDDDLNDDDDLIADDEEFSLDPDAFTEDDEEDEDTDESDSSDKIK